MSINTLLMHVLYAVKHSARYPSRYLSRGVKGRSVKPSTVSRVIPKLLGERGWSKETLAKALGLSPSVIEKRLAPGFSPCVSTLANTCVPLGYEVMLVPTGTEVEGGYKIVE